MVFYKLFHSQQRLGDKSKAWASGLSARSHQARFLYFLVVCCMLLYFFLWSFINSFTLNSALEINLKRELVAYQRALIKPDFSTFLQLEKYDFHVLFNRH